MGEKEEIENLRRQICRLKTSLMLTQISTIVFTVTGTAMPEYK